MNEKDLIYQLATEVQAEFGTNNWNEVSIRLGKLYGIVKTPNACKKAFQRSLKAGTTPKEINHVNLEYRNDGTHVSERLLKMSETEMKDPDFVLMAHGFDPNEFELISARNNLWQTNSQDGALHNYQSKISVRPLKQADRMELHLAEVLSNVKPIDAEFKLKTLPDDTEKYALEIDFADVHVGSLSWHGEVGADYDYKIAFAKMKSIVERAKAILMREPIEKLYICFIGDFLHIDTEQGTTTKGTKVDYDTRPKKIVSKALEMLQYIIENLAMVDTEVIWIEGNHSRLVEYTLFQSLPLIYDHAKHIKFDVCPKMRKVFTYGDNLIGLHHGDMNKEMMFGWLQMEHRELWGKAKYAETHSGHIHQEKVQEKYGIINRTNPTPKGTDLYEYQNGWSSNKTLIAYLWSKKNALQAQYYLR
jgi:hypothetical protein